MSVRILTGDCRDLLKTLPDESIHCAVTSPPYWGQRDYGVNGQIGLEPDFRDYISVLVDVFREVRRVLRSDGTAWINLGDCFATGAGKVGEHPGGGEQGQRWRGYRGGHAKATSGKASYRIPEQGLGPMQQPNRMPQPGLKPKDLCGLPWRVAFALQDDGWWLRRDIIWHKPNGMPESVRDRPATGHEYIFLLAKSENYFYDADAVKLPPAPSSLARWAQDVDNQQGSARANGGAKTNGPMKAVGGVRRRRPNGAPTTEFIPGENTCGVPADGVNLRSVWTIPTQPFSGAHFATFPPALIEPCILAGCPKGGVILDPFGGAGTTGLVADRLGRDAVLIELNQDYTAMAEDRLRDDAGIFAKIAAE